MTTVQFVEAITLKEWLDQGKAIVVDVREPVEYEAEHIPGSHHIPLASLTKASLPDYAGKKLVMHCMLGKRGGVACTNLLLEDPDLEIYNLRGGICAWKEAGLAVEK